MRASDNESSLLLIEFCVLRLYNIGRTIRQREGGHYRRLTLRSQIYHTFFKLIALCPPIILSTSKYFLLTKGGLHMDPIKEKIIEQVIRESDMDLLDLVWQLLAVEGSQ